MEVSWSDRLISIVVDIGCTGIYFVGTLYIWDLVLSFVTCFLKQEDNVEANDEHEDDEEKVNQKPEPSGILANSEIFPE